jgi:hypothetical protein
MNRKQLMIVVLAVLGSGTVPLTMAAEPTSAAPVEEDALLKTLKPGGAPSPRKGDAPSAKDKKPAVDTQVQQDPLLRSVDRERQAPAPTKTPAAKPGSADKPPRDNGKKPKDTKVQEDPLLKTLGQ